MDSTYYLSLFLDEGRERLQQALAAGDGMNSGHLLPGLSPQVGNFVRTNSEALLAATARDDAVDYSHGLAIAAGIGQRNVHKIPVDAEFRMKPAALAAAIEHDRAAGRIQKNTPQMRRAQSGGNAGNSCGARSADGHAVAGGAAHRPGSASPGGRRQPARVPAEVLRGVSRSPRGVRLRRRLHGQGLGTGAVRGWWAHAQSGWPGLQELRRVHAEAGTRAPVLLLVRQRRSAPAVREGLRPRRRHEDRGRRRASGH